MLEIVSNCNPVQYQGKNFEKNYFTPDFDRFGPRSDPPKVFGGF